MKEKICYCISLFTDTLKCVTLKHSMLFSFFLIIGGTFGFLAACIAYLITFLEYRKHAFEGWRLYQEALIVAIFTFAFFFGISLLIGYVLS